jgi:hypothetical protein
LDHQLDIICDGVEDLKEIAILQLEEVQRHNTILTTTIESMDNRTDRITKINIRAEQTIKESKKTRFFGQITWKDIKLLLFGRI